MVRARVEPTACVSDALATEPHRQFIYDNIFHVRGTTNEKARELNTLLVVPPSSRIVPDVLP